MRLFAVMSILLVLGIDQEIPLREGYAVDYSYRSESSPGIVFIATNRHGLTLSDTRDPGKLQAWEVSLSQPAPPYYIRVFTDHLMATNTESNTTERIALKDLVNINWKK